MNIEDIRAKFNDGKELSYEESDFLIEYCYQKEKTKTVTEEEIFKKYPKIFGDKDKPMTETCMCWGLGVPDAWLPIIDELCDAMTHCTYTSYCSEIEGCVKFPQVVAEQVKSKFNGLRFYYRLEYEQEGIPDSIAGGHMKYIDGMIAYAENRIYRLEQKSN